MLTVNFNIPEGSTYKILCLGAHCDDIEIGCGGTILKLIEKCNNIILYWVVFGSTEQREQEALSSAYIFLKDISVKKVIVNRFRDGFLPFCGIEVKECFEQLKQEFSPDIVFTHYRYDLHQDHRLIADMTWNTFRDHLILEYEIPKYDGDLGTPNFFVPLDESICHRKIQYIQDAFQTQHNKHWFTESAFRAILTLRGMESKSASQYAEAFYCRKLVF